MTNAIFIVVFIAVIVVAFFLWRFLMQRAIRAVIRIFRENGATSAKNAKTLTEMGLAPKPWIQRAFRARDYKPQALRLLDQTGCIKLAEAGRVWLSEETLKTSHLRQYAGDN